MSTAKEQTSVSTARARPATRIFGCGLGASVIGLGAVGLFGMPENCQIIGYIAAGLFIPAGAWLLFLSLRGRQSDLKGLTGPETADATASGAISRIVDEVIDKAT